jgi:hypothetical protein
VKWSWFLLASLPARPLAWARGVGLAFLGEVHSASVWTRT